MATGEMEQPIHLTLAQALEKTRDVSTGILVAEARVQQAAARLSQARATLLPQIDGTLAGNRQTTDLRASGIQFSGAGPHIGPYNTFDARVHITQAIFDAGAMERLRAARAGEKLSASQSQKAREDALALVATMYIQAQRAQQHVALARAVLKRDRKALEVAQTSYKQGTGSLVELDKAKAAVSQSRYALRAAASDALQKRLDVAAALKIPAEVPIIFDEGDHRLALDKADGPQGLSPDIRAARDQVSAQDAQTAAARADYWPKLSAVGNFGRLGETPSNASNTYLLGLQATIPIWEGGSKQASLAEARAKVKEARAMLEDAQLQNQAQVIDARADISKAKMLIRAKTEGLSVADEQMTIAQKRVGWGTGHQLDVDAAQAQKAQAQDERQEAMALLWTAKVSLAHALGRMESLIEN